MNPIKLTDLPQPNTFDEAVATLTGLVKKAFDLPDFYEVDRSVLEAVNLLNDHHGFGMFIRNRWGCWKQDGPLVKDFSARFKLFGHGDDVWGVLAHCVKSIIGGLPPNPEEAVQEIRRHWLKEGIDPATGERKKK